VHVALTAPDAEPWHGREPTRLPLNDLRVLGFSSTYDLRVLGFNSQIEGFLEDEGIKHEFSSPYTPQQNGVVERKNRTLLDMARTMLDEYKTSDRFWAEAINTA
jgi:transposase InsO family protein